MRKKFWSFFLVAIGAALIIAGDHIRTKSLFDYKNQAIGGIIEAAGFLIVAILLWKMVVKY